MSEHGRSVSGPGDVLARFVGVPFRRQTYRNLAYLLLAFPLGVGYFTLVTTGLSSGIGLAATLVGIPIVVATLAAAIGIGAFERRLAAWFLDTDIDSVETGIEFEMDSLEGVVATGKRIVTSPAAWMGLLLVGLKFVFGVVAFTALVTAGSLAVVLVSMPVYYDAPGIVYTLGPYVVDTLPKAFAGGVLGVVLLLVSLHVLNGLARFGGFVTDTLSTAGRAKTTGGDDG